VTVEILVLKGNLPSTRRLEIEASGQVDPSDLEDEVALFAKHAY
jgi:hypothetical protein